MIEQNWFSQSLDIDSYCWIGWTAWTIPCHLRCNAGIFCLFFFFLPSISIWMEYCDKSNESLVRYFKMNERINEFLNSENECGNAQLSINSAEIMLGTFIDWCLTISLRHWCVCSTFSINCVQFFNTLTICWAYFVQSKIVLTFCLLNVNV